MASYPSNVRTFAAHTDLEDVVRAAHMNDAQGEIVAIQQTLGLMPHGDFTTVRERIEDIEGDLAAIPTGTDPYPQYYNEARHSALAHAFVNHNDLSGLASGDPHPQYLTQARGDNRYSQLAHDHPHTHDYSPTGHTHDTSGLASVTHTHDYAASGHDHDNDYAALNHGHDIDTGATTDHTHEGIGVPSTVYSWQVWPNEFIHNNSQRRILTTSIWIPGTNVWPGEVLVEVRARVSINFWPSGEQRWFEVHVMYNTEKSQFGSVSGGSSSTDVFHQARSMQTSYAADTWSSGTRRGTRQIGVDIWANRLGVTMRSGKVHLSATAYWVPSGYES